MIPQFSVCIPAYRNPATLEACLRTVLDQPGDDYEIVVSDDQGPPGIRALVERLAQPDRIRYLRTPQRLGLRGNFEHCVTHSRGRYVTILGDDDGLCRNALDVARTLLASTQPDVFFWFPHIYWWPDALLPHKRWMFYVRAYAKKARLVNAREYVDRFYDDLVADAQRLVNRYGLSGSEFVVPPRFSGQHAKQVGVEVQDDGSVFLAFDGEPLGIGDVQQAAVFVDSLLR